MRDRAGQRIAYDGAPRPGLEHHLLLIEGELEVDGRRADLRSETRRLPPLPALRPERFFDAEATRRAIRPLHGVREPMHGNTQAIISTFSAEDIAENVRELGALHACLRSCRRQHRLHPSLLGGRRRGFLDEEGAPGRRGRHALVARRARRAERSSDRFSSIRHAAEPAAPGRGAQADGPSGFPPPGYRAGADGGSRAAGEPSSSEACSRSTRAPATRPSRSIASMGYRTVGVVPGYCLDPFTPKLDSTTIMYKAL